MKLLSINVGQAREHEHEGRKVVSAIWKHPVEGPLRVNETNLEGDRQVNLAVHGGIHKAVYAFSADQAPFWLDELKLDEVPPGLFGENLTISGLDERDVHIGDQWQIGSARFVVTGPRIPCSKLAMKLDVRDMITRFNEAGFPGVYLRVLLPGSISKDDQVHVDRDESGESIFDLFFAFTHPHDPNSQTVLTAALLHPYLDPAMAAAINKRIKA